MRKFIAYKRAGKSFNAEVRNRKDYRNPDFLLHSVRYQDIDQIGSCFNKEVFDPHGYDPSDYYDELGHYSFFSTTVCLHALMCLDDLSFNSAVIMFIILFFCLIRFAFPFGLFELHTILQKFLLFVLT